MTDHRPRSSYESDRLPHTKVTGRSAVRAAIGEELKRRFEVLQPVPQEMLALLVQVNALRERRWAVSFTFVELLPKISVAGGT